MYDIMVSRGCPYSCSYCCNSLFRNIYKKKGKYIRFRKVDDVIEELLYAKKEFPFVNMINIQDDGFASLSENYLKDFSKKYKEIINLPLRLRIIPTSMTEKKAFYLKEANTLVGVLGIQANDRINKELYNRHVSSKRIIEIAKLLKKYNIVGQYDIISQNPYETEQDMIEKCEILMKIPKPFFLVMFPLALFPNTPLREKAIKDGIIINNTDGYTTRYGNYPIKYVYLNKLQQISPYTPSFLLKYFLYKRKNKSCKILFWFYNKHIYKMIHKMILLILKNTRLVSIIKKIIFLPQYIILKLTK